MTVTDSIGAMLDGLGIPYKYIEHAPTRTSVESAAARGEPLEIGAKALLVKVGDEFRMFVLSAARKLDSNAVKQRFGVMKVRFASADELRELTGLVPGRETERVGHAEPNQRAAPDRFFSFTVFRRFCASVLSSWKWEVHRT